MDFYGDNFRWFIGTVIAVDSLAVGKVKIRIHGIHGPDITDDNLPFADVMLPSTEAGVSGIGKIPQLLPSSFVFGVFVDGKNSQAPLVLGSLGKFEKPTDIQKVIAGQAGNAAQFSSGNLSSDGAFISPDLVSAYDNGNSSLAQKRVIMMQFFTGNGFTANQAAGIIGNLQQESLNVDTGENFDPTVISKGSEDSIGLAQWNAAAAAGYRKNKLFNYAAQQKKDPLDFFLQLEFILHELRGKTDPTTSGNSHANTYRKLLNSNTFEGGVSDKNSTWVFLSTYERPADMRTKLKKREEFARDAFEDYNLALQKSIPTTGVN
tara:strand:- start:1076 stop:2035 length:960 start_codon:yes stop_codon:yes gene_type:complete